MSTAAVQPAAPEAFPTLLRTWRQRRRVSQLGLALDTGVSQRHLSFLESGRAKPSRTMVLQLTEALEVPRRDRNDWLVAAGFAPVFRASPLDAPEMAQVYSAVRIMLANHEPYPALAVDRAWNIQQANGSFERFAALLGADLWTPRRRRGPESHAALLPSRRPQAARRQLGRGRPATVAARAARGRGARRPRDAGRAPRPRTASGRTLKGALDAPLVPVLPLTLALGDVRMSLFTVIATFGTAQDITADELRIESLFPADAATDAVLRAAAGV